MSNNTKWIQVEPILRERIDDLNRQRQESKKSILIYGTLLGVVFSFLGFAFVGPFSIVFLIIGYLFVYLVYHSKFNKQYKSKVVPTLVDVICPGATYNAKGDFPFELLKASKLYPTGWGEHYKNEDTIRGKVGNTDFVYGELRLSHTQQTGKTSIEVVDFQGFAFEADFNKHFQGHTLLSTERMHLMSRVGVFSDYDRITLEDVNFDEHYRTYSTNDQEARYILTPALQHRIMEMEETLRNECGAREVSISFKGGRMLIMVQSKDNRFEVKYDLDGVKRDFTAFCILVDIVEQLNLNLRIWTKE